MIAVQVHQQGLAGEPFGGGDGILEFGLAMLFAFPQLVGQAPARCPGKRLSVRSRHSPCRSWTRLLCGLLVFHGVCVDVGRNLTDREGGDGNLGMGHEADVAVGDGQQRFGVAVQPLPEAGGRWEVPD